MRRTRDLTRQHSGTAPRRADRRHGARPRLRREASPRAAGRDLAGERGRSLPARGRHARRTARSELHRLRTLPHRRRRLVSLRHGAPGRLSVGKSPERVAAEAHPLLALRSRISGAARHADVLPRRPALPVRPDLQLDPRRARPSSGWSRSSSSELTEPDWALGFRFDIVLGGREATPLEEPHDD